MQYTVYMYINTQFDQFPYHLNQLSSVNYIHIVTY